MSTPATDTDTNDSRTVHCRECNTPINPRETDTVALVGETLVVCTECWSWTGFDGFG